MQAFAAFDRCIADLQVSSAAHSLLQALPGSAVQDTPYMLHTPPRAGQVHDPSV